ncbi:MAG: class I adenylate-forming enzyme family protein [Bacillota bacterium]
MNLPLKLAEHGQLTPHREAVVYQNQRLTYGQLNKMVNKLASGLKNAGIQPGDRVLVALENCPEFIISYYAIIKAGGIVVPVDPQYTINEMSTIVLSALPAAVITDIKLVPLFTSLSGEFEFKKGIIATGCETAEGNMTPYNRILASSSDSFSPARPAGRDDVIVILYTSGATGAFKGAMLTHHNLYSNAATFAEIFRITPSDKSLLISPAYLSAGQTCIMNTTLVAGATMVVHKRWKGPEALLEAIQNEKVTFYFGPPTMYTLLVKYPHVEKYDLGSWRLAFTGGAPTPIEVFKNFEEKYGFGLIDVYGLSETSPLITSMPLDGPVKVGSIGVPIPGVEVKVVDYEDREVPTNQIGEIIVKGPNVMKGYYNHPEETDWVMRNGWFHTGDLAYMDKDGYIFIVDRKKDIIIRGGVNIRPREIEEVLYTHPAVFDAAVTGMPDPVMGEEVMAFILLRENCQASPEEIQNFCVNKLARYKIPKHVRFVENLPKTTSGKLLRKELQKMI